MAACSPASRENGLALMGLHDREYYRSSPGGGSPFGGTASMCSKLIAANVVVFVLQLVTGDNFGGGGSPPGWIWPPNVSFTARFGDS
jgi:hypothetical protein